MEQLLRKTLAYVTRPFRRVVNSWIERIRVFKASEKFKNELETVKGKKIIYLGIVRHNNLGDLAQFYCIRKWIDLYCSNYSLIMADADTVISKRDDTISILTQYYRPDDIIIFQSGYTTQDLGGIHDYMHRLVATHLPNAKMLMMPQTIYFKKIENRNRTARILDNCINMFWLSRDQVSYEIAKEMFPHLQVKLYPDIVTSLIGSLSFNNQREGIFLCHRNDGEKFFSDEDFIKLKDTLQLFAQVDEGDTNISVPLKEILEDLKRYIENKIEKYSHYKVTITDRYHGTIFSLCAGTPVIILRTNDHKVTSGADWFKDVYPGYVTVSDNLAHAVDIAKKIIETKEEYPMLTPYFEEKYYGEMLKQTVFSVWD